MNIRDELEALADGLYADHCRADEGAEGSIWFSAKAAAYGDAADRVRGLLDRLDDEPEADLARAALDRARDAGLAWIDEALRGGSDTFSGGR